MLLPLRIGLRLSKPVVYLFTGLMSTLSAEPPCKLTLSAWSIVFVGCTNCLQIDQHPISHMSEHNLNIAV